jgi:hypothetical protein
VTQLKELADALQVDKVEDVQQEVKVWAIRELGLQAVWPILSSAPQFGFILMASKGTNSIRIKPAAQHIKRTGTQFTVTCVGAQSHARYPGSEECNRKRSTNVSARGISFSSFFSPVCIIVLTLASTAILRYMPGTTHITLNNRVIDTQEFSPFSLVELLSKETRAYNRYHPHQHNISFIETPV